MATVTKSIGTNGREYGSISLWEADLDNGAVYSAGDDAVGECYADSVFDESFTINGGGTVGLSSITLSVAAGERHDGTAGSGARIVRTANGDVITVGYDADLRPLIVEWLEVDKNGYSGRAFYGDNDSGAGKANLAVRNNIFHGVLSTSGGEAGAIVSRSALSVLNNIFYDLKSSGSDTGTNNAISVSSNRDIDVLSNTVHLVDHARANELCRGIAPSNRSGTQCKNNLVTDVTAATASLADCFLTTATTAAADNNASSDDTADDIEDTPSSSLINIVTADQYVSTVAGSEDLHLKSGADAIDAGTDLGVTPTGVNIDIDGRDRDAEGDTWDIGAHEFVSAGGGGVTGTATLTDSAPTLSGVGKLTHTGSGAHSDTIPTLSGAGKLTHTGSGAHNDTAPTLNGSGTLTHTGTGTISDTIPTITGVGSIQGQVTGAGALTDSAPTLSGSGVLTHKGAATLVDTVPTVNGAGIVSTPGTVTGTANLVDTAPTLSGVGKLLHTGTGIIVDTVPALSGAGVLTHFGSGTLADTAPSISGIGIGGAVVAPTPIERYIAISAEDRNFEISEDRNFEISEDRTIRLLR